MIELFDFDISGNCHKVRLMLSLLGLEYQRHAVNLREREQKSPEYLGLNPFGQVPVLKDGDAYIRDSQAILVYLARAYGAESWFPNDAIKAADITAWLSIAANEIARGPAALRAHFKMGRAINVEEARAISENVLTVLELHLARNNWLATSVITIADIAVYPYIALAHEGKIDLSNYRYIENWLGRIETLQGFVNMPGIVLRI